MAHINLLPWREELRQERQQQFISAIVAGLVFAGIALYGAVWYADGLLAQQAERNQYLKTEHAKLDLRIIEIKTLEAQRNKLIGQMDVINELQISRPKVVKVFDALVRSVPDGIHLDKVERRGEILTLNGVAQSNARVSVFMRGLDDNAEFDEPKLNIVQRTSTADDAIRQFTLKTMESKPKKEGVN